MNPKVITAARWKTAIYLAICLVFVATWILIPDHHEPDAWKGQFGGVFFGLGAVVFTWMLVRPQRLELDNQGFMLAGGLVRTPKKVLWREVEPLFVYRLPKGGKMIGYNYRPEVRKTSLMAKFTRAMGADGSLSKGWPVSPERMVDELNAYRTQALGAGAGPPADATTGPAPGASRTFGRAAAPAPRRQPTVM